MGMVESLYEHLQVMTGNDQPFLNWAGLPDLHGNKNDNGVDQIVQIISFDLPTSCGKNSPVW